MLQLIKQFRYSLFIVLVLITILLITRGAPAQANSQTSPISSGMTKSAPEIISWNPLPNQGLDNDRDPSVRVLAKVGSDLYVGGDFSQTGDGSMSNLGGIARFDTIAGTWNALSNQGLDGPVYALEAVGTDLYVGGFFDETGDGTKTNLGKIVRYDTKAGTWNALGNLGLNNTVLELAASGSDLYVGGYFTKTGDQTVTELGCISRYDTAGGSWNALSNEGLGGGYVPMPSVKAVALSGTGLYVGGNFSRTGDKTVTDLGNIAYYDLTTNSWNALSNKGLRGGSTPEVYTVALTNNNLYVGGDFYRTGDSTLTDLGNVAHYDITSGIWNALPDQGFNDAVLELFIHDNSLYAGGYFSKTGDGTLDDLGYIARYDMATSAWDPLPNQGLNEDVRALAAVGSTLYVGGDFTQTGDGTLASLGYIVQGGSAVPEPDAALFLPCVINE